MFVMIPNNWKQMPTISVGDASLFRKNNKTYQSGSGEEARNSCQTKSGKKKCFTNDVVLIASRITAINRTFQTTNNNIL